MKLIYRVIGLVILLCVLLFLGTCYFKNCREETPVTIETPDVKYKITVRATGNVYFSDYVKTFGTGDKEIVYMVGYWENVGGKYVFKEVTLPLNEEYFGEIRVEPNEH